MCVCAGSCEMNAARKLGSRQQRGSINRALETIPPPRGNKDHQSHLIPRAYRFNTIYSRSEASLGNCERAHNFNSRAGCGFQNSSRFLQCPRLQLLRRKGMSGLKSTVELATSKTRVPILGPACCTTRISAAARGSRQRQVGAQRVRAGPCSPGVQRL